MATGSHLAKSIVYWKNTKATQALRKEKAEMTSFRNLQDRVLFKNCIYDGKLSS